MAVSPNLDPSFYKQILSSKTKVTLEEAIFRSEQAFRPSNLQEYQNFWEQEILKDNPHKLNLIKWISGVTLEEFLNSFTESEFQGGRSTPITLFQKNFLIMSLLSLKFLWTIKSRSGYRMWVWKGEIK